MPIQNRPSAGAAPAETSRAHAEAALAVTNLALGQRGSCRINIGLVETAPAATNPAPGRSGSCRNESGPRPKRLLPKRYRPPAEAAPAEALPAPPKRLLPNSHSSRAGQIPPFRVARSRTGKVPTVGLQSGADLRGARGDSLVRRSLSVPDGKGSPVHGGPLARSRTPRRLLGSGYS